MTTQILPNTFTADTLLRYTFRVDGIFTTVSAIASTLFANTIAPIVGLADASGLLIVGISMIAFGLFVLYASAQKPIQRPHAWFILGAYDVWIVGSVIVLANNTFNSTGVFFTGVLLVLVIALACITWFGLQRSK
jgi:hypothetical protein